MTLTGASLSDTKVSCCRSGCSTKSRRWRPARLSRTSSSAQRWHSCGSCRHRIRQTVGGAIHDASGRQTIWKHRVCRQRDARHAILPCLRRLLHDVLPPTRDNPSALDRPSRPTSRASWRSLGRQRVRFPALRNIGRRSGAALRKGSTPARRPTPTAARCHFNFAQPMTFQPCADTGRVG